MRTTAIMLAGVLLASCASSLPTRPNDREWKLLTADYAWIQTLRDAQPSPPPNASRKQMIETELENHRKLEKVYAPFLDKLKEYHDRTGDPRAAALLAHEKMLMGDDYMNVLSRYDKALEFYRAALELAPNDATIRQRIAAAESGFDPNTDGRALTLELRYGF